jgi:hypothetical protein
MLFVESEDSFQALEEFKDREDVVRHPSRGCTFRNRSGFMSCQLRQRKAYSRRNDRLRKRRLAILRCEIPSRNAKGFEA